MNLRDLINPTVRVADQTQVFAISTGDLTTIENEAGRIILLAETVARASNAGDRELVAQGCSQIMASSQSIKTLVQKK